MADQREDIRNKSQMQKQGYQQKQGQEFKAESPDVSQEKDVEFIAAPELKEELEET